VAQYEVGRLYEVGLGGFPKDLDQAKIWYRKAADQNDQKAKDGLRRLEEGRRT
jgi:TPR repeat protein